MPETLASLQTTAAGLRAQADQARVAFNAADAQLAVAKTATTASAADLARLAAAKQAAANQRDSALDKLHSALGDGIFRIDPSLVLQSLDATVPIALLPVRLETRFNPDKATELLVRILPDDVHGDTHEPELTPGEVDAGKDFWTATWRSGTTGDAATAGQQTAWARLAGQVTPTRAAWVAQVMAPSNPADRPAAPFADDAPLPSNPIFPEPPLKGDTWTRAPWTTLLPDRWVVLGYRAGQRVALAWGNAVPDHVHLGPDPTAQAPAAPDAPRVDDGLKWVIDFATAEAIGLGVRLTVPATGGLDRLIAFGLRSSLDPDAAAASLGALIEAHHYTNGVGFIPPGTPTNNTPSDRAGWSTRPTADELFATELRPPQPPSDGNANVAAAALGIDPGVFLRVPHAADSSKAAAMATVMWPATLGYYLEQLLQFDGPTPDAIAAIRRHFIDHVRPAGPLPALRVGNQPYGLLPVTSLQKWKAFDEDALTATLPKVLNALQLFWQGGSTQVPRLGGSADLDADFIHALTQDARSQLLQVRTIQNPTFCSMVHPLIGVTPNDSCASSEQLAALAWFLIDMRGGLLGHGYQPRIASTVNAKDAPALRLPLVDGAPGPATYLATLRTAPLSQLTSDATHVSSSTSVLATLARHGVLLAYGAAADELGRRPLSVPPSVPFRAASVAAEAEVFGVSAAVASAASNRFTTASISPVVTQLTTPIPSISGAKPVGDFLRDSVAAVRQGAAKLSFLHSDLYELDAALGTLQPLPVDALEGLLAGTLDACSYRFDAWVTSLATRRLTSLRGKHPRGTYVGGFGWVENLQRGPTAAAVAPPLGETSPLRADAGGGFIHGASMAHAATAAVLRSAHLSHAGGPTDGALAIDLSSHRVRLAVELLDGVRNGQTLGALLGYRLERALHDAGPALELDRYIAPLRQLAPLVASGVTPTAAGESLESIAARNVVDGLALSKIDPATVRQSLVDKLAGPPAAELNAVLAAIATMTDSVDALSDLLLSESVYQLVSGNPLRAGITVDAISRGTTAPEPEVIRTHRPGTAVNHRLLIMLPATAAAAPGWTPVGARATTEPRLDAWAGRLLGDPARVRLRATFVTADGKSTIVEVALPTVGGVSALDVVCDSTASGKGVTALEQRLVNRLLATPPAAAPAVAVSVTLLHGRAAGWDEAVLSFDELMALAASINAVIVGGRKLTGVELARPEDKPAASIDAADLTARSTAAVEALTTAKGALDAQLAAPADATVLLGAIDAISGFGLLPGGQGVAVTDVAALAQIGASLSKVAGDRLTAVGKLTAVPRSPDDSVGDYDTAIFDQVFGGGFRVLPICQPANASTLRDALAASGDLQGGDPTAAWNWLRRYAAVQPAAARLAEVMLFGETLGTGAKGDLRVGQIPFAPGARWAALPGDLPDAPTTSLVVHAVADADPVNGVTGLFLDEWVDVVPATTQTTALSFQAATPRARAPQSVLLAVSPDPSTPWDLPTIEAVLNETLDLAQQRMVDLTTLPALGHYLPAIYVADTAFNATIGIRMKDLVSQAASLFNAKAALKVNA